MNLQEFLNQLFEKKSKINREEVVIAVRKAATTIFGKPDEDMIQKIVDAAIPKAKDTEDAIQIGINMMRGRKR